MQQVYGRAAQSHLERPFDTSGGARFFDDVFYGGPIKEDLHASDTARGYPDVYVNGEDVTVTVDPLKNSQWILPHNADRHASTVHRGALKDHAGVMRVQHTIDRHRVPEETYRVPTAQIDDLKKYTPRSRAHSTRGRDGAPASANYGELPVIAQALYEDRLPDKLDFLVERETWFANTHGDRTRFFDCSRFAGSDCR